MTRDRRLDACVILAFACLACIFFWPVTVGGKTMLPADTAFQWQPWQSYAGQEGITYPHNALIADLYLENLVWKRLIVQALSARQVPLWNPYILAGVPFLAAGQHSALYPFSVLFYVLPLPAAYGWFAALHAFLAQVLTYVLGRSLRLSRTASAVAGVSFAFGGYLFIGNVFPMIVAAAVWLPLVLAVIEHIVRAFEQGQASPRRYIPWALLGAVAYGMVFLAGHPEMYYYIALVSGAFAAWRLTGLALRGRRVGTTLYAGMVLAGMALLGLGFGAAQWFPLLQVVRQNFREGAASFSQVLGWAYPKRRVISLLIPDFFGNPSHHRYFDLFSWHSVEVTVNALGERINNIYWDQKNYVEGASYVGTLPIVLALVGLVVRRGRHLFFWALAAIASLLFVFGSPLYILVFKLPGLSQVHSPFRWVYVYSLAMAVLAAMGVDALRASSDAGASTTGNARNRPLARVLMRLGQTVLPWGALLGGTALIVGLGVSLCIKDACTGLADKALQRLALATQGMSDGRMFYSYEFRNLLIFGLALATGGALLVTRHLFRHRVVWACLLVVATGAELYVIGRSFFPALDKRLVRYSTPAIEFLKNDTSLYRITSYVGGSEKTANANMPMLFDIQDARGYDSIIPKQYADYMAMIEEQSELQYNRIAPLFDNVPEALDSPLLDMLNVKYVLTAKERTIANRGYTLVYDGEIRIYRNDDVLPRGFLVEAARCVPDPGERSRLLRSFDPRREVVLEKQPENALAGGSPPRTLRNVEQVVYLPNQVTISVDTPGSALLVLGDSYAPGWKAYVSGPDARNPEHAEQEVRILRANGNFRAVEVPAGRWVVRFRYSPDSIKFGLYGTFMSVVAAVLLAAAWIWLRVRSGSTAQGAAGRVARNTFTPMAMSLINKLIDMAFAMLMLRVLGPADAGAYYLAVVVISWFDIFTNFGLNTLLTREVAKDAAAANRYLANTLVLRMALCVVSVPILGAFLLVRAHTQPLSGSVVLAIALFGIGLLPSNVSAALSSVFNAYERMEIPAGVATLTTLLRVSVGALALVLGTGYVGLAAASIAVNLLTMLVLLMLLRVTLFHPHLEVDWSFQRRMLSAAYPLMINHLLATLFFKVAVLLLEWLVRDQPVVGWYSTAYKYIDAIGVIPAYFTLAVFPLMSRYAATDKNALVRAYRLSLKLLWVVAMPLTLLGWAFSRELILVLGGSEYLPDAGYILRVMIWYMPFGFVNSVTQYVLIALDQQRFLTRAFAIGLVFNVLANLVLIRRFGYMASAGVAILSELVLFIPFWVGIRRNLKDVPFLRLAWRQVAAALPMSALLVVLPHRYAPLSLSAGMLLYLVALRVLHAFDAQESAVLRQVLSWQGLRRRMSEAWLRARA